MIQFFKDLIDGFKKSKLSRKILYISLMFIYVVLMLLVTVKVNVEVITPGGVNAYVSTNEDLKQSVSVYVDTNNDVGEIFTVGVHTHKRISVYQYLISKINKDIDFNDYDPKIDLSRDEDIQLGKKSKDQSIINALIVAYNEAKKVNEEINIDYEYEGVLVALVQNNSKANLKPDDVITHFNDEKIESLSQFSSLNSTITDANTSIKLTVIRDGKTLDVYAKKVFSEETNSYILGVTVMDKYTIDKETVFPNFEIHQNYSSIGGSGGAMTTLAIYNALIEEDITNGKRIIGTGTISLDGKVGKIGGVSQKIVTAKLFAADVFFVGPEDYEEAKAKAEEIKAEFPVVKVETFSQIIEYLQGDING